MAIVRDYVGRIESIGPMYAAGTAADDTDIETWLDVSEANARLIATAPDLLAALQKVQQELANYRDGKPLECGSFEELKYLVVDAAIAKATGESC